MSYDFTPLFRSAIGFDRLARVAGNAANAQAMPSYPPYNIEKTAETDYALTMALAGFGPEDVEVLQEDNTLVIRGRVPESNREREWLHRGIATRAFERRFALADHTEIDQAELRNGLLTIVVRQVVPEAARPRRIPIVTGPAGSVMAPAAMGAESCRRQVEAPHAAVSTLTRDRMVPHTVLIIAAHPAGAAIISRAGLSFSSPGTPIGACAFAGP